MHVYSFICSTFCLFRFQPKNVKISRVQSLGFNQKMLIQSPEHIKPMSNVLQLHGHPLSQLHPQLGLTRGVQKYDLSQGMKGMATNQQFVQCNCPVVGRLDGEMVGGLVFLSVLSNNEPTNQHVWTPTISPTKKLGWLVAWCSYKLFQPWKNQTPTCVNQSTIRYSILLYTGQLHLFVDLNPGSCSRSCSQSAAGVCNSLHPFLLETLTDFVGPLWLTGGSPNIPWVFFQLNQPVYLWRKTRKTARDEGKEWSIMKCVWHERSTTIANDWTYKKQLWFTKLAC